MSVKETRPAAAPAPSTSGREAAQGVTRRQFLRSGMYGAIGLFSAQALVGAGVMLWPAKVSGFGGRVLVPKKLREFSPNDAPFKVREGKFYLSAVPEGIIALYWKCPHLGCTVPWNEGENLFHCPCHGSIYEKTGQNVGGPAPRPMDYMEIEIDGEDIWVDTSKIHERPRHLPEHVTKVKW